jgi:hypothetical protein
MNLRNNIETDLRLSSAIHEIIAIETTSQQANAVITKKDNFYFQANYCQVPLFTFKCVCGYLLIICLQEVR